MNKRDGHEGGGRREGCNQAWEGLRAAVGAQPPNPTLGLNIPGQKQEALHSALPHVTGAQRSPLRGSLFRPRWGVITATAPVSLHREK